MAWTASAIFQQAMLNPIAGRCWSTAAPTTYANLSADAINCALYTVATPDKTAALASTLYATGAWSGTESSGTNYTAGGTALASKTFAIDTGSSSICFSAANPSWATATLSAVWGCLVYDATTTVPVKQGLCYNYFGGAQSVTAGTFLVQWATPVGAAVTAVFSISV